MNRILFLLFFAMLTANAFAASSTQVPILIGTYTRDQGEPASRGIYRAIFDQTSGKFSELTLAAEADNPSFLAIHPGGMFVYAVLESNEFDGHPGGGVMAFSWDRTSGALRLLNQQPVGANAPCHLAVDATGTTLIVANYGGGSVSVFPVSPDGSLGERSDFHQHSGSGPNADRQTAPHAHGITISPDNRFVMVTDLGIDQLKIYRLDASNARLLPAEPSFVPLRPGSGPRHFSYSPDGLHGYCVNELDNTVTPFAWDADEPTIKLLQPVSTLPPDWDGKNTTAEVAVHPGGQFVVASNRGHDSLAVFRRDSSTGLLTQLSITPCGGQQPRSFAFSPDGKWIVVANQGSDSLVSFAFDPQTGQVSPTKEKLTVGMPVCVVFDD